MKIELNWPADEHTRYSPEAFAHQIGKEITLNFNAPNPHVDEFGRTQPPDLLSGKAILVAAEVTDDRRSATFTLEIVDPELAVQVAAYTVVGAFPNISVIEEPPQQS